MKAFPVGNSERVWDEGMDLRDYFAAQALPTIVTFALSNSKTAHFVARQAYDVADAMMQAREQHTYDENGGEE